MALADIHRKLGAALADDGIPLHYGDLKTEYHTALECAVLMDRSHEGRLNLRGRDRLSLIQRISTNDVLNMEHGEGRPTIFTNPNGRILDRVMVYDRGDKALMTTEPGRNRAVLDYLRRQIFFNDDVQIDDLAVSTCLLTLHGPLADVVIEAAVPQASQLPDLYSVETHIGGVAVTLARRKTVSGKQWAIIVPETGAEAAWSALLEAGQPSGLIPAGSLTYNTLRIRAGRPGAWAELTTDYIPLEAGLWDEVSFSKGCYTGQEIIARMESRNRLAKTLVQLRLEAMVDAPAEIYHDGRSAGVLTSSVTSPDGDIFGLGFVKVGMAVPEQNVTIGVNGVPAVITALAGAQPPMVTQP